MSAAAINTAPTAAPGAPAAAGSATGAGTGVAHGAPTGLPAIFQAMLATLAEAEDAATAGAASAQLTAGGKPGAGAVDGKTSDGKTKGKIAGAASGLDAPDGPAAIAAATTAPNATVALLIPAVTTTPAQSASTTAASGEAAAGHANPSAKALGLPLTAPLIQPSDTVGAAVNANARTDAAVAPIPTPGQPNAAAATLPALNGSTVGSPSAAGAHPAPNLAASAVVTLPAPAGATASDPSAAAAQAPTPALAASAVVTAPTAATASDPSASGVQAPTPNLAADALATLAANTNPGAKPAPNPGATDSKPAPPRQIRAEASKAAAGPSDATAVSANTAGKNADTLAPVAGGGSRAGGAYKDDAATAATDTGRPDGSQAPGDPATSSTTTPATLAAAAAVAVRGSPQTVANLAAQIIKKLDARSTQFDVQLDPAGLGKVDVRLQIGADGKMSAAMSFDTPQAAAELRSRSHELQQALAQSGFDVSGGMSFDVSTDRGQGGQAQNQQPEAGAAFRGRAFQAALDTTADTTPASQLSFRRTSASGVDIRI